MVFLLGIVSKICGVLQITTEASVVGWAPKKIRTLGSGSFPIKHFLTTYYTDQPLAKPQGA